MDEDTPIISYATLNVDKVLKDDLQELATKYADNIGLRKLSMNDMLLIMVKQFKAANQL